MSRLRSLLNQLTHISTLPAEIFLDIIQRYLSATIWPNGTPRDIEKHGYYWYLRRLREVCRSWRDLIDGSPILFAYLCVDDGPWIWQWALAHSEDCELMADIIPDDHSEAFIAPFLAAIATRRIKSFELTFDTSDTHAPDGPSDSLTRIKNFLFQPHRSISNLNIKFIAVNQLLVAKFFGGKAPALQYLSLEGRIRVSWPSAGLKNLLLLRLNGAGGLKAPDLATLISILRACPTLKHLELANICLGDPPIHPPTTTNLQFQLHQLDELILRHVSSATAGNILTTLSPTPRTQTVVTLSDLANIEAHIDPLLAERFAAFIMKSVAEAASQQNAAAIAAIELLPCGSGIVVAGRTFVWNERGGDEPETARRDLCQTVIVPILIQMPAEFRANITAAVLQDESRYSDRWVLSTFPDSRPSPTIPILHRVFRGINTLTLEGGITPNTRRALVEPRPISNTVGVQTTEWLLPNLHSVIAVYSTDKGCRLDDIALVVKARNTASIPDNSPVAEIGTLVLKAPSWSKRVVERLMESIEELSFESGVAVSFDPGTIVEDSDASEGEAEDEDEDGSNSSSDDGDDGGLASLFGSEDEVDNGLAVDDDDAEDEEGQAEDEDEAYGDEQDEDEGQDEAGDDEDDDNYGDDDEPGSGSVSDRGSEEPFFPGY